jgi:hypothetical protein
MNDNLTALVIGAAGVVNIICFVIVLIQMFQRGATGLGITCIVLALCCGMGVLVAFVYGWMRARDWNITNLMTVWTIAVAIDIAAGAANPAPLRPLRDTLRVEARTPMPTMENT